MLKNKYYPLKNETLIPNPNPNPNPTSPQADQTENKNTSSVPSPQKPILSFSLETSYNSDVIKYLCYDHHQQNLLMVHGQFENTIKVISPSQLAVLNPIVVNNHFSRIHEKIQIQGLSLQPWTNRLMVGVLNLYHIHQHRQQHYIQVFSDQYLPLHTINISHQEHHRIFGPKLIEHDDRGEILVSDAHTWSVVHLDASEKLLGMLPIQSQNVLCLANAQQVPSSYFSACLLVDNPQLTGIKDKFETFKPIISSVVTPSSFSSSSIDSPSHHLADQLPYKFNHRLQLFNLTSSQITMGNSLDFNIRSAKIDARGYVYVLGTEQQIVILEPRKNLHVMSQFQALSLEDARDLCFDHQHNLILGDHPNNNGDNLLGIEFDQRIQFFE